MLRTILLSLFVILFLGASAQVNVKDSSITISMINVHAGFHTPQGDLADRFGYNGTIGAEFQMKFKKNFIWGVDYSFIYGKDVKNTENYLHALRNDDGYLIDANGQFSELFFFQRGFNISAQIGYQFNVLNLNPNSGPYLLVAPGLMQHFVRIENPDNVTPQIADEYLKGYDRLTNGFSMTEFVGYRFLSNNRLYNFYFGFEATQAWTQSRRSYNYDDRAQDTKKRMDMIYGFKVGWMIPFYGRVPNDYYYY